MQAAPFNYQPGTAIFYNYFEAEIGKIEVELDKIEPKALVSKAYNNYLCRKIVVLSSGSGAQAENVDASFSKLVKCKVALDTLTSIFAALQKTSTLSDRGIVLVKDTSNLITRCKEYGKKHLHNLKHQEKMPGYEVSEQDLLLAKECFPKLFPQDATMAPVPREILFSTSGLLFPVMLDLMTTFEVN